MQHRRRPAGAPCALLAAIVCVLTAVAAGPGDAELAVALASSAAAGLVGLALAAPGLIGASVPAATGHARRSDTPNRSLEPHYRDPATVRGHHFPSCSSAQTPAACSHRKRRTGAC